MFKQLKLVYLATKSNNSLNKTLSSRFQYIVKLSALILISKQQNDNLNKKTIIVAIIYGNLLTIYKYIQIGKNETKLRGK